MANIFQYNRLEYGDSTNKEDIFTDSDIGKTKLNSTRKLRTLACPAYSALYPEYRQESGRKPISTTTTKSYLNTTLPSEPTSKVASKSDELIIKKYQKWSRKLLLSCQLSTEVVDDDSHSSITPPSEYFSQQEDDIATLIVTTKRKTRVSDCMRNFLRKRLFLQLSEEYENSTVNEGLTSNYDEADILDCCYNAEEEDDADSNFFCNSRITDNEDPVSTVKYQSNFQLKPKPNLLAIKQDLSATMSLKGCLKAKHRNLSNQMYYSSHSDEDLSDIGTPDSCQLLTDNGTKRRNLKKEKRTQKDSQRKRYMTHGMELLQAPWYQPHLSTKAANERLRHGTPGDFILRRRTGNYQLSLRLKTKIKHFVILDVGNGYKFKDGKKQFATLQILITHHSVMAEQLPMTLTLARPEILNFNTRRSDDFDSFESLEFSSIVKCMQAKCLEFI